MTCFAGPQIEISSVLSWNLLDFVMFSAQALEGEHPLKASMSGCELLLGHRMLIGCGSLYFIIYLFIS